MILFESIAFLTEYPMEPILYVWRNRIGKFLDNPRALVPFLKKHLFFNFIADRYLPAYASFKYLGYQETINEAIAGNRSLIRFGDELFDMLQGIGLYFGDWKQPYSPDLARRLKEVLRSRDPRLLLCFNPEFILKSKKEFKEAGIPEQYQFWTNSKIYLKNYYYSDITYGSALCFHPRYNPDIDFEKIGKYFSEKHVFIVTSGIERFKGLALGKTTTFIEAPKSNAWKSYSTILSMVREAVERQNASQSQTLVLVSMGSTAKILVYDLTQEGYVAWDTGQFFDLAAKEIRNLSVARA